MFHIYRPNTGLQQKQETIQEIRRSYEKVCKVFLISFRGWPFPANSHFQVTHMPSYHCSDNVSIEWNKGNQAFKLYM
jgi:hypothetical protein